MIFFCSLQITQRTDHHPQLYFLTQVFFFCCFFFSSVGFFNKTIITSYSFKAVILKPLHCRDLMVIPQPVVYRAVREQWLTQG